MASVASAASTPDNGIGLADKTFTPSGAGVVVSDTDFSGVKSAFTMQIVLDWDAATGGLLDHNGKSYIKVATGTGGWSPLVLTLFANSDGNLYMGFQAAKENAAIQDIRPTQGSGASLPGDGANIEFTAANYKNADGKLVVFASYDPTASSYTLYGVKNNGSVTYASANGLPISVSDNDYKYLALNEGVYKNGGYGNDALNGTKANLDGVVDSIAVFDHAMNAGNVKYYMQTSIPEPATATLSLLALAGLAARRRRK